VGRTWAGGHLGATGVQIGWRAVGAPGGVLPAMAPGGALSEAPSVTYEALKEVGPDKETGALAGVTDRLAVVREAVATVPAGWPTAALPGERGAILLAIAPEVGVDAFVKIADGLAAGGPAGVRVLRPGTAGEVLPLHLRMLPAELEAAPVPAWEKAVNRVLGKDRLEVWAPDCANEGVAPSRRGAGAGRWATHGPGSRYPTHPGVGGNTSCVEIRAGDHVLVCDGGTGIIVDSCRGACSRSGSAGAGRFARRAGRGSPERRTSIRADSDRADAASCRPCARLGE